MTSPQEHLDTPNGYPELLEALVRRIAGSQTRAALAISRELVLLYWSIGAEILLRQKAEGWGATSRPGSRASKASVLGTSNTCARSLRPGLTPKQCHSVWHFCRGAISACCSTG